MSVPEPPNPATAQPCDNKGYAVKVTWTAARDSETTSYKVIALPTLTLTVPQVGN